MPTGVIATMNWIAARWNRAKVNPCKGWIQANTPGEVVNAAMPQRITPAPVPNIIDELEPIRRTSRGPISRNITTSANTDPDQSALMVKKSIPAPRHRITAKKSCIARPPQQPTISGNA